MPVGYRAAALAATLVACQPSPETAHIAVQPQTRPIHTITSFNEALRCMDDLFQSRGIKDIYITSAGIPDATGTVTAGTKEMLISAVSKMSAKSGALHFVDYDPTQLDVQVLSELVGLRESFVAPRYYIRGAITQLDSNVLNSSASAAVSLPYVDLGVSKDQVVSVMTLDLNVGQLVTRQIMSGMSASNSIAVVRTTKSGDVGGVIGKAGVSISVSFDKSEGFHQAARNLVELSTIEVIGKLSRMPYWQCLQIDQTNPTYLTEAREWFDTMGAADRVNFTRSYLTNAGYIPALATDDVSLRNGIARYQAEHDLVPNGTVNFELYYSMLAATREKKKATQDAVNTPPVVAGAPLAAPTPAPAAPPPMQVQVVSKRGDHPTFRLNENLVVEASMNADGFLYCYYQDAVGSVARIFPNRFQPNAYLRAGGQVEIPPADQAFNIRFDKAKSHEAVACIASPLEVGLKLPDQLKVQDLTPMPVGDLKDVIESFRRTGGQISEGWLPIEVM